MSESGTAIVTGGAGGIGKATVRRLLAAGLSIFVVDSNQGTLDSVLEELSASAKGRLAGCRADVTDEQQVIAAVSGAADRFGDIYALVHIAGGAGPKRARDIEDFTLAEWTHVIDLNLTSAFLAVRAALPHMRRRRQGRIVLFSSIIADGEKGPLNTVTGRLPYATAKSALLGFTNQLAKDVAKFGITVNALMPGLILGEQGTRIRDRFDALPVEDRTRMLAGYPGGRPGSGDDVAAVVAFLLSPAAIGLVFVVYLSSLFTTPYTGWLVSRFGRRNFGMMAIATWICGILLTLVPTLPTIVGGLMIAAASGFYIQTCCQSFVSTHVHDGKSSAIGLYVTSFYIGGSFGGLIPGLLWNSTGWQGTVGLIVAMLLIMVAMIRYAWRSA